MTYYKIIERDEARNKHLKDMEHIVNAMCEISDRVAYFELFNKLELYKTQLELYDKIMGYSKCLMK